MKKNFLDSIEVKSPCGEKWDEMTGNNEVRFCSHCARDVHNISEMTRSKAEKLLQESNERLCVRYVKDPSGQVLTASPKLTNITRRATLAASVLATSMALSTLAYAQVEPTKTKDNSTQTQKDKSPIDKSNQEISTISGVVTDQQGAVIANAKITLREMKSGKIRETRSDGKGFYEFQSVEPAIYQIEIEVAGFEKLVLKEVEIAKDIKLEKTLVLKSGEATMGVTSTSLGEEIKIEDIKTLDTNIHYKQIIPIELPKGKVLTTMGLVAFAPEKPKTERPGKPKKKKN